MERIAILACMAALVAIPAANLARNPFPETVSGAPRASDRLAGFECSGAPGALYAAEEDRFPRCRAIEPLDGPPVWQAIGWLEDGTEKERLPGLTLRACLAAESSLAGDVTACERTDWQSPVSALADALEAGGCDITRHGDALATLEGCNGEAAR